MAYIGRGPEYGAFEKQDITGDGSTTTYTLDYAAGSESSILVSVAGVVQRPGTAYNLSGGGTSLVFSAAPANGAVCFVIFFGMAYDSGTLLGTGTITGQTVLSTSPASADMFLVYDDDASALKKVAYSDVHSGVANMVANTVKVRDANSTGAPSDKVVADTQLLIGDGTGFTAATLSGDVTLANTGAVTIAANAVDSAEITAGSIDFAHMSVNSIDSDQYVDGSIDTVHLAANAVTLAKIADGTQGGLIYMAASGAPTELAAGTSGYFLKTLGSSANPAWAEVPAGAPTGGGSEKVFYENENSVDTNYTLTTNFNAVSAGPVTVASGVTVTIPAGQAWVIV